MIESRDRENLGRLLTQRRKQPNRSLEQKALTILRKLKLQDDYQRQLESQLFQLEQTVGLG